jgi:hypothetical protein
LKAVDRIEVSRSEPNPFPGRQHTGFKLHQPTMTASWARGSSPWCSGASAISKQGLKAGCRTSVLSAETRRFQ